MLPMIGDSLSVIIQGENSQRILFMSTAIADAMNQAMFSYVTDNGYRRCRRHMRTWLGSTGWNKKSFTM